MKFKVGDKVKFDTDYDKSQHGEGVIVDIDVLDIYIPYLVHSEDIESGHNGALHDADFEQDNNDNWWFKESSLMKLVDNCDDTDESKESQKEENK